MWYKILAFVLLRTLTILAQDISETCSADDGTCRPAFCEDESEHCEFWATEGECDANPSYMRVTCRRSCNICSDPIIRSMPSQAEMIPEGTDMGVAQTRDYAKYGVSREDGIRRIESSREYMKSKPVSKELLELCRNGNELCTVWALAGECDNNPVYMKKNCAPACQTCNYLSVEGRCPIDPEAPNAWASGDLDKMFNKLTNEPYLSKYSVQVWSSPVTEGPWLITLEDVISEEEAQRLIELGRIEGYKLSSDVGKLKADGSYDKKIGNGRTSTNAWCQHECYKDATAQAVVNRLSNLTGIDEVNSEYLQLLRYEPGQFYITHHDYISHDIGRQQGVRILTFYLYLNDVEEGGGTNFDELGVTVTPKRGRAVLWSSVLNDRPNEKDDRTTHQALPVERGIKYGANAWFHMRDFKTPNGEGCQ